MPEFPDFRRYERDDRHAPGFTNSDMAFLASLDIQEEEQFGASEQQLQESDLELYRGSYVEVINRREEIITTYMENGRNTRMAEDIEAVEELTYTYFRSYVGTMLRAQAGSIDAAHEIANALSLADASQVQMNMQKGKWYQFDINQLNPLIIKIIMATGGHEQAQRRIEELYEKHIRDVAMSFVEQK